MLGLGRQAARSRFAQQSDGDGWETRGATNERRLRVAGASSPEPLFELCGGEIGVEVDVQDRSAVLVDLVAESCRERVDGSALDATASHDCLASDRGPAEREAHVLEGLAGEALTERVDSTEP